MYDYFSITRVLPSGLECSPSAWGSNENYTVCQDPVWPCDWQIGVEPLSTGVEEGREGGREDYIMMSSPNNTFVVIEAPGSGYNLSDDIDWFNLTGKAGSVSYATTIYHTSN